MDPVPHQQTERGRLDGDSRYKGPDGKLVEIRNVWADNLEEEMAKIREVVEKYPYIAMDTEFPGVVARPLGDVSQSDYQYQTLRCNVDLLKIIQLGLSFANEKGEFAEGCCCWQFNFKFSLDEDMYAQDSIDLLKQSGLEFRDHCARGIDVIDFGELLIASGLVLVDNVTWISFHSGYDFGYLLGKVLTSSALPGQEKDFFTLLKMYFPRLYDIKYLMANQDGFHGGLNKLGDDLAVERIGQKHQAGSDSLLTAQVFFKIVDTKFNGMSNLSREKYNLELFGYGNNNTVYRPALQQQPAATAAMMTPNKPATSYTVSSNSNGTANVGTAFASNGLITMSVASGGGGGYGAPLPDGILLPPAPGQESDERY
ncbi:ribonuclease H-like domain-containing protein [Tribonema minus]|uniref:poly(A)-specific ribonuclease n=1 Tax=Tribonema minus TaxID=303371 RepID=A0A836C813_9STRA|nr:ribonuclease H-like domain-containing protein [Tribonema minus]